MTWADLTSSGELWFTRMKARFPHIEDSAIEIARADRACFEAYLARVHNITTTEAREEIEDFLFFESLTREVTGFSG